MKGEILRADASLTGCSTLHFTEQNVVESDRSPWPPSNFQLQKHSCSFCSASSRPPNFIHFTVTCPTNLAVPSLLSTLPHCLMPLLTTLGVVLWFIYPIYHIPHPCKTNRKVIRVTSPKLLLSPFTATFCAHVLCVFLCGSKISLFQQRRMNNGLAKRHWETCIFHSCTLKSSLGLFPFLSHLVFGWCMSCMVVFIIANMTAVKQPQYYTGKMRVRYKFPVLTN